MDDHIVVNMVVRTRDKARVLRHMIEMVEGMLPEPTPEPKVSEAKTAQSVTGEIVEGEDEL